MSDLQTFAASLSKHIRDAERIAIMSHVSPDGDNLGSLDAMYGYLTGLDKDVVYIGNDDVPEDFTFLTYAKERVDVEELRDEVFDLLIALDSSDIDRFGDEGREIFLKAEKTANIDHHLSNDRFADINYVVPKATSTGEVLFRVLEALDARITPEMATALYTAISTDTGSFQYDSVDAETHRVVAKLYDAGCDHNIVVNAVYQSRSREKLALMTRVLSKIQFLASGKVAMVSCLLKDLEATGASSDDTEGIVEQLRNIKGVEMAVFLKEKQDEVKLSFRSKSYLNCIEFAEEFDGGGHVRAAGASAHVSIEKVEGKVRALVDEKIDAERA
ncbi:MAG: bifunctional oligoribonuclease/PAP phosphatase NrnA [Peptoniphilus sp.]|nr:bifunctional oligoribonuclease/PAP phosphatase NrnA [Peptoniphilus sp.]MDD7362978.1 bifunctional oligoribonuclease/PAP phosphatase NrnA [Bacillota bacterium]MDY6044218.1 bifunctional oligoribonuclease/PAP phosphatase NrnA [Peptoniphilus sp.]